MKSGQRVQNAEMASSLTFINNEVGGPFLVKKNTYVQSQYVLSILSFCLRINASFRVVKSCSKQ